MHRNPNRKERGVNLRDGERHLDTNGTGNAPVDGYTRRGRRPRDRFYDEMVTPERADMVEGIFADMPLPLPDYD